MCFWVPRASDELLGFLATLHDYFEHRAKHPLPGTDRSAWPSSADLDVRIHPYINVGTEGFVAAFPRMKVCVASPNATLPKSIWVAKPPTGNTTIMCDVHVESNDSAIIAWHGRTYEFRTAFNVMGIPLAEESNRFRLLPEEYRLLSQPGDVDL